MRRTGLSSCWAVALCGSACAPLYGTPAAHLPLFRTPGELHVASAYGSGGFSGAIAYAALEHLEVLIEGQIDADGTSRRLNGGAAAGYFNTFGGRGALDALAGISYGAARGDLQNNPGEVQDCEGPQLRAYFQAGVGMRSGILDIGAAVRATYVRIDPSRPKALAVRQNLFAEPTFVLRLGWDWIKAELQAGLSLPVLGLPTPTQTLLHFALGLVGHFDLSDEGRAESSAVDSPDLAPVIP